MATNTAQVQQQNIAMAYLEIGGQRLPIFMNKEWRDPLAAMAQLVNQLLARLDAAGL